MPTVQEATAKTQARIAAKKRGGSSSDLSGVLDAVRAAGYEGSIKPGSKGDRVEYFVTGTKDGRRFKSTRYARSMEELGFDAPIASDVYASDKGKDRGRLLPTEPEEQPTEVGEDIGIQPEQPVNAAQTGQLSYEQALQNLRSGGLQGDALASAEGVLANKYQVAHQQLQASGGVASGDAGQSMARTRGTIVSEPDRSVALSSLTGNPNIDAFLGSIMGDLDAQMQTSSIMDDYRKLYRQSGLEDINEEMIDAETVINGTEDDIRNEIQTAGGFGTDSQIQAMALARNKNLLKRYNALAQMQTNAQRHLDTMLQLTAQDKQMAQQMLQSRISNMFNMANFAMQAQNNIKEGYWKLVDQVGFDGVYDAYANDPRQLARLEQATGIGSGMLRNMAAQARVNRAREQQMLDLDMRYKEAQIYDIYAARAGAQEEKTVKAQELQRLTATNARDTLTATTDALKFLGSGILTSGLPGAIAQYIPSTSAKNLAGSLRTIKANLAFDRLQEMRNASPTGGALGAISDRELRALESAAANLEIGLSGDVLNTNILRVQQRYLDTVRRMGYQIGMDASGNIVLNYPQ